MFSISLLKKKSLIDKLAPLFWIVTAVNHGKSNFTFIIMYLSSHVACHVSLRFEIKFETLCLYFDMFFVSKNKLKV